MLAYVLGLTAMLSVVGCVGPTYVNIPPEKGDVALHGQNRDVVRTVAVQSIGEVISRTPLRAPVILRMPKGTDRLTVAAVIDQIDHPMVAADAAQAPSKDEAARITVHAIRIRGTHAEVDVYRAAAGSHAVLDTAYLHWIAGKGWSVNRLRTWRIAVPKDALETNADPDAANR